MPIYYRFSTRAYKKKSIKCISFVWLEYQIYKDDTVIWNFYLLFTNSEATFGRNGVSKDSENSNTKY